MMTTAAAMLGALPLALGGGDGAELRQPLGISIVGGLIVSQALTLYTTPVIYLYLDRFRLWSTRRWRIQPDAVCRSRANERAHRFHSRSWRCSLASCKVGPDYVRPVGANPATHTRI